MSAQRREDDLAVEPVDQTVENASTVGPEDVRQHGSDADAATVEHPLYLIPDTAALRDQRPPMAADAAQVTELQGGNGRRVFEKY